MNATKALNDVLDANPNIKFDKAVALLLKKYKVSLSRSNYDKIKCLRNKNKNKSPGKKKSKVPKSNKKPDALTMGGVKSTSPPKPELTREMLKGLSIKKKLLMLGEYALDEYLLTGNVSRILTKAVDLLSKDEFLDQGEIVHGVYWTSDTPPYKRPEFLYDHQKVAMSLMEIGHLLWQASRQLAGKTTATFLKDCEDMLETPNTLVALVAPTVPLAVEVLFKFLYDPIVYQGKTYRFYDQFRPYMIKDPNQLGFSFKNGSRLQIISLNSAGSQGRTINIIHIEEIDKLGKEASKRLALAGIINSIRKSPNAIIRITSNNATGIFRLLKQMLFEFGKYFSIYVEDPFLPTEEYKGRHTIVNENVIYEGVPKTDEFLKIFSQVLVSFAFAKGQLYNIDDVSDETFNPDKVEIAYRKPRPDNPIYIKTTMGIDPGGKIDAFGVSIWSLTKNEQIPLRWCKRYYNAMHEAEFLAQEIAAQYILYNVEMCEAESSAGSVWLLNLIANEVDKQSKGTIKFRYNLVNFQGKGKILAKDNFVMLFKILLDYELLMLKETNDDERAMHQQMTLYIPNKNESNNNPDDLIESGFHGIWELLGGWEFINKLISKPRAPVVETM